MGVVGNGLVLLVSLFVLNQVWTFVSRRVSNIPQINQSWAHSLSGKGPRPYLQRAYNTYSKAGKTYSDSARYVVPPALFPEVRKLPSTVLNSSAANEEVQVLLLARSLGSDYWDVITFVRHTVLRGIAGHVSPAQDEISFQFKKYFSTPAGGAEWQCVPVWSTTFKMMGAIAARFLVGESLSRNEVFTKKLNEFARAVGIESVFLRQFPTSLRPIVGLFLKSKTRVRVLKGYLRPLIMDYLVETDDGKVVFREIEKHPNDPILPQFIAFVIPKYDQSGKSIAQIKEMILDEVSGRLLGIFFAAIDTTTMTFSHVFMDLAGHSQTKYADVIRNEIESVLQAHDGQWSFEAVSELKHLDSFIHETLRLHPVGNHLGERKVMPSDGWTFSNGDHLPQGSVLELPTWFIQTDEEYYKKALDFEGFRFVDDTHPEANPSDIFTSFGHGNHACPGRRFALMIVKFMVIEMLINYEYEAFSSRPDDWVFGAGIMPDMKKEARIRPRT